MAKPQEKLSWRERQVLDALLELGEASVKEVRESLPDPPGYSAVRALLAKLERKGLARHTERALRYVYTPCVSRAEARETALNRLVRVFYDGSAAAAVTGLVELSADRLSEEDLDQLEARIAAAREGAHRTRKDPQR